MKSVVSHIMKKSTWDNPQQREAHSCTAHLISQQNSDKRHGASQDIRNNSSNPVGCTRQGIGQGQRSTDSLPNLIRESDSNISSYPSYDSSKSGFSLVQGSVSSSTKSSLQTLSNKEAKPPQLRARGTWNPKALGIACNGLFHQGDLEGATVSVMHSEAIAASDKEGAQLSSKNISKHTATIRTATKRSTNIRRQSMH